MAPSARCVSIDTVRSAGPANTSAEVANTRQSELRSSQAAATAWDDRNSDWRVFATSALVFAGPALRTVSIETHRALGAIGYAEEHEAPRHFRRVHADLARFGGVSRARAELADVLLGPIG